MKRLFTAFIIALSIHGLILGLTVRRMPWHRVDVAPERPVTITFTYRTPPIKAEKKRSRQPVVKPPEPKPVEPPKRMKPKKPVKPMSPVVPLPLPQPKREPDRMDTNHDPKTQPPPAPTPMPPSAASESAALEVDSPSVDKKPEARALTPPARRNARPLYRQNPPPHYPGTARRRGYEGSVLLEVKVLKDGTVGDLRILESSGYPVLDEAALKSVRRWLFEPGMQGDTEVDMWVRVPIRFEIE